MFSTISPNYEKNLKEELFGCFKHIGIPFDVLDRMPVRDRKYYIAKHNGLEKEKEEMFNKATRGNKSSTTSIDRFTDMSQGAAK